MVTLAAAWDLLGQTMRPTCRLVSHVIMVAISAILQKMSMAGHPKQARRPRRHPVCQLPKRCACRQRCVKKTQRKPYMSFVELHGFICRYSPSSFSCVWGPHRAWDVVAHYILQMCMRLRIGTRRLSRVDIAFADLVHSPARVRSSGGISSSAFVIHSCKTFARLLSMVR